MSEQGSDQYSVETTPNFDKELKRLCKKYHSLVEDLSELIELLKNNPTYGTSLGNGLYKIRITIASKGKGKSGGARVITCVKIVQTKIVLATIYDKSEQGTITPKELKRLLQSID